MKEHLGVGKTRTSNGWGLLKILPMIFAEMTDFVLSAK